MIIGLQIIGLLFLLALMFFFLSQFYGILFRGFAPFISSKQPVIERVVNELMINDDSIIYELGSGRAPFLREVRNKNKQARLMGIEQEWLPYIISQIQNSFAKTKVVFKRGDLFKADIGEADIIYCYLNVGMMEKLENKFIKEAKPGAVIVSNRFAMPEKEPFKVLEFDNKSDKVYLYKM